MDHLSGTYNEPLVVLSCLIAVAASYSALDLAGRINTSKGKLRMYWLICGAVSMGLGIWSMHFVGMLALSLPIRVSYDIGLVLLSVLFAIAVSYIALLTVNRKKMGSKELLISGGLMAAGISGMHYVGMAGMLVNTSYNSGLVILSVLIAATASIAALALLSYFRKSNSRYSALFKLGSAVIMGAAIAGMHYTGMAAAHFHHGDGTVYGTGMQIEQEIMAYIIVSGTFLMLGITLVGVLINNRFSQKDLVLQKNERWYRSLYENNTDGIISVDNDGRILSMNPAVTRIAGFASEDFANKHISVLGLSISEEHRERTKTLYYSSFNERPESYETAIISPSGTRIELSIINVPVVIDNQLVGNHIIARDITEEKRAKDKIKHLAFHDDLTGLPNRRMFDQKLKRFIEEAEMTHKQFAVMVIDIDRFKMINDSLGHTYGDIFLKAVSARFNEVADVDHVTLARMGGDEFTIICPVGDDGDEPSELAKRLLDGLKLPFRLKDNDFYISASIGIAVYPKHGKSAEQLLKSADTAMYDVKKLGKNGYRYYSSDLDKELLDRIELEADLRKAIERNELLVYYQPQFRAEDSRMVGVEALVRWKHPSRGILQPGAFIPIAEEAGMIFEIGTWVLREACRQMREWHVTGGPLIPVAVNLSAQQFHQSNLVNYLLNVLNETGLEAKYLELEITESMMMDAAVSAQTLRELNQIGVRISLDDFGTGYSSLGYLKTFPIHKLKIDRSFITEIAENDNDKAIVSTIISMAQNLNLDVVAEGIETKDQLDILTQNQCKELQGYYFSRPLSAQDVEKAFFIPLRS
ncbi:EAL domain-containing protein [Paenibacillus contaminans]|uniref:PAS domain S-box protein n=1 Tax=Paenibacillus contaminans TaxID=450362 RepID=A0A329MNK5_9BACL|nr:EAL domain-containing protein [Paenibacillus contaminans]RAV21058.1 PAS domain S-box protein [Paenibacillus contaminans]